MNLRPLFAAATLSTAAILVGCGASTHVGSTTAPVSTLPAKSLQGLHGSAHGGQQPINGARVQIYQAGTTGYGAGAKGLIANAGVLTDAGGNFSITGTYTCDPGSYVYIVSVGGDPGVGQSNPAAVLVAGLGLCDNLSPSTFISLNEVTTVATAWALQSFISVPSNNAGILNESGTVDPQGLNIGAPYANSPTSGLAQAFADINTLVNVGLGSSPGVTAPGVTVPSAQINTIADILAVCVNTTGPSTTACFNLIHLAPTTNGFAPVDTVQFALSMARSPWLNASAYLQQVPSTAPFRPTLTTMPDFTLGVTYTGSGINGPSALAVDKTGNVWIANSTGNSVTAISHTGTVLSGANGFTAGSLNAPSALAVDNTGNIWVTNKGNSTITVLDATGANLTGSPFSGGGLASPLSLAIDANANVWVANTNGAISEFNYAGASVSGVNGYALSGMSHPTSVAINPY